MAVVTPDRGARAVVAVRSSRSRRRGGASASPCRASRPGACRRRSIGCLLPRDSHTRHFASADRATNRARSSPARLSSARAARARRASSSCAFRRVRAVARFARHVVGAADERRERRACAKGMTSRSMNADDLRRRAPLAVAAQSDRRPRRRPAAADRGARAR